MPNPATPPPSFVNWQSIPQHEQLGWERHWFDNELDPSAVFNVRGLGLREPMFNADVHRPFGTGDWLIMFFHEPARLKRLRKEPSVQAKTLILWPPSVEQFYSWGARANEEPHSWMHVEGSWVVQQVEENCLQSATPISLQDESIVTSAIQSLIIEMTTNEKPDPIILQNHFQNWARSVARHAQAGNPQRQIPKALLRVRAHLDENFSEKPELDTLAKLAAMSPSHLCHQFRKHCKTTISKYVVRKRMSIAQRLLYDLNLRPGEIAKKVGYPDIYQFSKQFKNTFGVSPNNYRKQQMQSEERS